MTLTGRYTLISCHSAQGTLIHLQGISLSGSRAVDFEAFGRMPSLRILVLDGVKMGDVLSSFDLPHLAMSSWRGFNPHNMLFGFHLPYLAMLSWRDAGGVSLPFALETVRQAAVLDISRSEELLKRLPLSPEACFPHQVIFVPKCLGFIPLLVSTLFRRGHSQRLVQAVPAPPPI